MKTLTEAQGMHVEGDWTYRGYELEGGVDSEGYPFVRVFALTDRGREHLRTFTDPDKDSEDYPTAYKALGRAEDWVDRVHDRAVTAARRAAVRLSVEHAQRMAGR